MVGMLLLVYAKEDIVDDIRDVRTAAVGVGMMGLMVCVLPFACSDAT
jgi:hypothetical protein